jgi:hypothetical protein
MCPQDIAAWKVRVKEVQEKGIAVYKLYNSPPFSMYVTSEPKATGDTVTSIAKEPSSQTLNRRMQLLQNFSKCKRINMAAVRETRSSVLNSNQYGMLRVILCFMLPVTAFVFFGCCHNICLIKTGI